MSFKIIANICSLLAGFTLSFTVLASTDSFVDSITGGRPTPCLDAVNQLQRSELLHYFSHEYLVGVGQANRLSSTWDYGDAYFEKAHSVVFTALSINASMNEQLSVFTPKMMMGLKLRRATPDEQKYLRSFFSNQEGRVYWDYMQDGAQCEGFFEAIAKQRNFLTTEQKELAAGWKKRLAVTRQGFDTEYRRLNSAQRSNFETGFKLMSRLSKTEAPDEVAFQKSLISDSKFQDAVMQSLPPVAEEIKVAVDDFKKSGR